jgi:hypothetical protein
MDFSIEGGPFSPLWLSILANYLTKDSTWLWLAKFGTRVHLGSRTAGNRAQTIGTAGRVIFPRGVLFIGFIKTGALESGLGA